MTRAVGEVVTIDGHASIDFDLDLDFGARWIAEGVSPTGVRPIERVRLDFSTDYPERAPQPSYRTELGRGFPHVQPWLARDGRPVPCLTATPADEFVAANGLTAYVDQFWLWLRRAANDHLMVPDLGWEPSRRDDLESDVIIDRAMLRALPDDTALSGAGYAWLETRYVARGAAADDPGEWFGEIRGLIELERGYLRDDLGDGFEGGRGFALVLWATSSSGSPPIFDRYEPDDVTDFAGLVAKADRLMVSNKLRQRLRAFADLGWTGPRSSMPMIVVFLVRRPWALQGESSPIEILPYVLPIAFPGGQPVRGAAVVKPLRARDRIEVGLLQRFSGTGPLSNNWVAVGSGSLGSKIGLHLARAGRPPMAVIDRGILQPHNVARHGLYPEARASDFGWYGTKAQALAAVLQRLTKEPVEGLALNVCRAREDLERLTDRAGRPVMIVNTTASLVVRESLSRTDWPIGRTIDAELYDVGRIGVLRVEGPNRNPNSSELIGAFMALGRTTSHVGDHLFRPSEPLSRIAVGEGCSSETMVLEDASLALHSAALALAVEAALAEPPAAGRIEVWHREDGGLVHQAHEVGPFQRISLEDGWTLSVSAAADAEILADIARHRKVETGGVILGRVSPIARSIQVVGVLPATPDSIRRRDYFELGVKGVEESLANIHGATGGALYCVGTWHSHLGDATPSGKDRTTAARLAAYTPYPLCLLIRGAQGYRGVFAGPGA